MKEPITITPAALKHLKSLCERESAMGFRLSVKKSGCSGYRYVPDLVFEQDENDLQFTMDGLLVCIPKASHAYLRAVEIDLDQMALGQTQLLYRNPNATNHCGCGESFSLKDEAKHEN